MTHYTRGVVGQKAGEEAAGKTAEGQMKRALVTGGAGFIGSNIVKRLLVLGIDCVVLDNLSSGYRENLLQGTTFIEGDIRDRITIEQAMFGCDLVFHLAASVGNKRSIEDPVFDSAVNLLGTLNVLEAARRHGIERIVFSSSAAVYGEMKNIPIRENHPQDPDSPYGISKLAAERMCLIYNKLFNMHNICLRYFNVYGLNQRFDSYGNVIPIFVNHILNKQPLTIYGDGKQTRDFINVGDVAVANVHAAQSRDAKGVFNIGSATNVTISALARTIQDLSGIETRIFYALPRPGDVQFSLADIKAANGAFAFVPNISLTTGLSEYIAWTRNDPVAIEQREKIQ